MYKVLYLQIFYNILEYEQAQVNDWLVDYSVQTDEIHQALFNLSIDFQELKNDLFNIKIRNDINITPMRSYIEEWLERELKQATDERQQTVVRILEVVDDINEMVATSKYTKG
jgi:succinate dehydrogenase flavin-adding protein (antitoxin of CptAB toxin-antitoxin module)